MLTLSSIGQSLQKERKNAGISIVELASRTGLSRNTISSLESGHGNVELNTIISICHILKLSLQFVPDEISEIPQHRQMQRQSPLQKLLNSRLSHANSNERLVTTFQNNVSKPNRFAINFDVNDRPISISKLKQTARKKFEKSTSIESNTKAQKGK